MCFPSARRERGNREADGFANNGVEDIGAGAPNPHAGRWLNRSMITIGKYRNLAAADIARIRLTQHGVEAVIADEAFATAGYGGLVVDLRLQVRDEDAEKARGILADTSEQGLPEDFDPGPAGDDEMSSSDDTGDLRKALDRLSRKVENATILILVALVLVCVYIAFRIPPREEPSRWDRVSAAVGRLDYNEAIRLARPLIDETPNDYHYRHYMTYLYLMVGDLENAEAQARSAYETFPTEELRQRWLAIQKLRQESKE